MNEYILLMEHISKTFPGTQALNDVSISLKPGEILAVVGENGAGKSTMMNILGGAFQPDPIINSNIESAIIIDGNKMKPYDAAGARAAGIGFVHQELFSCLHLTVAENVFMGQLHNYKTKLGFTDYHKINMETVKYLEIFGSKIKPTQKMRELKIADQQVVEIIKSISINCKILIFDEPTSSLTETEVVYLFETIRRLKDQGIGIIYISHRMEEVFELSDRIVVLRDGYLVDVLNTKETNPSTVVSKMVGRDISDFYPPKSTNIGETILEVENLCAPGLYHNISFRLRKGEILGFSGLIGAGRTEVAFGICGLIKTISGILRINGKEVTIRSYSDAINNGLVYLSEDRKQLGLFLRMKVKQNICSTNLKGISGKVFIKNDKEIDVAKKYVDQLNIRLNNVEQKVASLSGGNQQKIMVAKWLYTTPKVFILDEPTRGIDVGAKTEIHNMLRLLASEGTGIIIISSELQEIIGMCDRVIIMRENNIMGEIQGDGITEEGIMKMATAVN